MNRLTRWLYTIVMAALVPFLLGRLLFRSLRNPDYRAGWPERLGFSSPLVPGRPVLWVHAVSVGEVQAAVPLIRALQSAYPEARVLVTTTTPTGRRRLLQVFGATVMHRYLPFDVPVCVEVFLRRTSPSVGILMETELWPNLVHCCARAYVPMVLANARMSERSARGYGRFASLTREMLRSLRLIAAQSAEDARRLTLLGALGQHVVVTGNIKLDVQLAASISEVAQVLRRSWGPDRSVWIAASTHAGEEEAAVAIHQRLRNALGDVVLVLVPRHPERAQAVATMCRQAGLTVVCRTQSVEPGPATDVYVGDTMGELPVLYAASDVAFVGGSLVEVGGHNMLEPAALGVPVLLGPHLFNFADLAARIVDAGAGIAVDNASELEIQVRRLLTNADGRHAMGEAGQAFVADNRGAVKMLVAAVRPLIDAKVSSPAPGAHLTSRA